MSAERRRSGTARAGVGRVARTRTAAGVGTKLGPRSVQAVVSGGGAQLAAQPEQSAFSQVLGARRRLRIPPGPLT